jgi:hypothetical protein
MEARVFTEKEIKLEARLTAIEYMVANALAMLHHAFGSTPKQIIASHDQAKERLRTEAIPGLDPAQSDMFVAEIQTAVENILASIEEMTGANRAR